MKQLLFFQYVLVYIAYELTCVLFSLPYIPRILKKIEVVSFFLFCFSVCNAYDVTCFFLIWLPYDALDDFKVTTTDSYDNARFQQLQNVLYPGENVNTLPPH